jgi:UTP--glucose-1-phosphate uridylyltransferase
VPAAGLGTRHFPASHAVKEELFPVVGPDGIAQALCLGDHLFRGKPVSPCQELAQLASVCGGHSVSAVNRISPGELKGYGTIAGTRRPDQPRLIDVSLIIEKPDPKTAQRRLRVDGLPEDVFLGWFGMHLLAPSIYEVLEEMIRNNVRDNGEFQLTPAQEIQRQREGYLALEMTSSERFDFGVPDDFLRSLLSFRVG